MKRFALIVVLASVLGCDQKDLPEPPQPNEKQSTSPTAVEGDSFDALSPPAPRMTMPPALRTMRLADRSVGTITAPQTPERTLNALGLAACQTGWTFQGLYFNDEGVLVATQPMSVGLAEIPVGKKVKYQSPDTEGRALLLDFDAFGYDRIVGTLTVLDTTANDAPLLKLHVDGKPTALANAPGLGPAGCFDTGYWMAESGDEKKFGPVTAVYDPANLHYVGARITPTVSLVFLFTLKPAERGQGDLIKTTVAKIQEKPDLIPIRIYLERRTNEASPKAETGPLIKLEEHPLVAGELFASFTTGEVGGPIRLELKGAEFPKWDGPLSGAKVDRIRLETLFVTDSEGEEVPLPSQPDWFERPPVVLP